MAGPGSDELARVRSLAGVKWTKFDPDVIPAWVADMDFDPAPEIKAAVHALVDPGDLGYMPSELDPLIDAWAEWLDRRHGWRPDDAEVRRFTGTLHALEVAMILHTSPGDGVAFFSPIYYPFRTAIEDSGRRVVDIPLDEGTYRLDPERMDALIDRDTRVILFCQPHNPTGRVFDREELAAVAEIAQRRDLLVISDEVWADVTHAPIGHLPLTAADERFADRLVTIGSTSKAFNITGTRCAVAHIGSPSIRASMDSLPPRFVGAPSTLGVAASIAAWTQAEYWLDETTAMITANRDHLAARLAVEAPDVGFTVPEATYLGWLDFGATTIADHPAEHLLDRARVALHAGDSFGSQSTSFARINFATPRPVLDEIIDRIVGIL